MESDEEEEPPAKLPKRRQLTSDRRKQIVSELLTRMKEGDETCALIHGSLIEVAILFDISRSNVGRIWKRARETFLILKLMLFVLHLWKNLADPSSGAGMTWERLSKKWCPYSTRGLSVG
jgi:hypothetical protein